MAAPESSRSFGMSQSILAAGGEGPWEEDPGMEGIERKSRRKACCVDMEESRKGMDQAQGNENGYKGSDRGCSQNSMREKVVVCRRRERGQASAAARSSYRLLRSTQKD